MDLIAGQLPLADVMRRLADERPLFHSEADFQFAFARVVDRMAPDLQVRLEVRQPGEKGEYVDLVCYGLRRTLIEFKYATAVWSGTDGATGETFTLRSHAAMDLTRKHFVHDVTRLERFVAVGGGDGIAILLANDRTLWLPPHSATTRDRRFRLHEGAELSGQLIWGDGDHPPSDRTLRGTYTATWKPYSALPGPHGEFRWLGWCVAAPLP